MDSAETKRMIEALLFVGGQPIAHKRLAELLPDLASPQLRALIATLNAEYTSSGRAFAIQEVAGGYQLVTDPQLAPWIRRALQSPKPDAVSTPALETLAIVAYRQPIGRADISEIRGVDVGAILKSLLERGLVDVVARGEGLGRPLLYATTPLFLEQFALRHLEELPRADELAVALRREPQPL